VPFRPLVTTLSLALMLAACNNSNIANPLDGVPDTETLIRSAEASGMVRITVPNPDPGLPAYARAFPGANQFFHNGEWLAIPFYRAPAALPADFNLLEFFHFPGPNGPGAFATPILIKGFYLIEPNAPRGTFPLLAVSTGDAVPIWFVRWSDYRAAMADNVVTIGDVIAMRPLRGIATKFNETLKPRLDDHLTIITASGKLDDGRTFEFHVTHVGDTSRTLRIAFGR
jgi:hypothetical protein